MHEGHSHVPDDRDIRVVADDHDVVSQDDGPIEDNPIWQQENVTLRSVGIDIGSSGTQVVFSLLKLQRSGAGLATRFVVIERDCTFASTVSFTPFTSSGLVDAFALGTIIDDAYAAAGMRVEQIDTGVVILTGEALRRQNAEKIAMVVSERAGDFVCASAGDHMEATLAAHGSGAVAASAEMGQRLLNVDIGGGTTKLSVVDAGQVVTTAALHVGGRLVVADEAGRVVRLEEAGHRHGEATGVRLRLGEPVSAAELDAVAETMADVVVAALRRADPRDLPYLTEPIGSLDGVAGVVFSGGVSEYVYGTEDRDFGDLGRRLGSALRRRLDDGSIPFPLVPAAARIRATALGASQFSVQLSGNTCDLADADTLLPRRNVQVVRPAYALEHDISAESVATAIRNHLRSFDVADAADVVLALTWSGEVTHPRLHALCEGVVSGLQQRIDAGRPVLVALDADIARNLGATLREEFELPVPVLAVDGLQLWDFDYIDLGRPLEPSNAVPVTIKSLVF
jgi:ethanolamine utilization protein EutA